MGENEDVVQICHAKDIQVFAQNLIHPSLERRWYIGQPKRHDAVLVQSVPGSQGCFPFVSCCDLQVVIGVSDIEFSVDGGTG